MKFDDQQTSTIKLIDFIEPNLELFKNLDLTGEELLGICASMRNDAKLRHYMKVVKELQSQMIEEKSRQLDQVLSLLTEVSHCKLPSKLMKNVKSCLVEHKILAFTGQNVYERF